MLEESEERGSETPEKAPTPEKLQVELQIATDKMAAYIRVKKPSGPYEPLTYETIMELLRQNGISYGVLEDDIREFCEQKKYFLDLKCAEGLAPVDQEDGQLEYQIIRDQTNAPIQREDGTVDFHDLGLIQNVLKGDVLCRIIMPKPGKDGIDIFARTVAHRKGKIPKFPNGRNTVVSEDGLTLTAGMDGCVEYKNACLNINDAFVVRGNVDSSSGNIDFLGTVTVQGDVREGFSVKAGRDIIVRGTVEGAALEAGGSVAISNGMVGMGRGKLKAGGDVRGKYFENVVISCEGDLFADTIMNCRITAGGSVILKGRNALLAGGICQVGKHVYASTIGTASNSRTDISIVSSDIYRLLADSSGSAGELEALQARLAQARLEQEEIKGRIAAIVQAITLNAGMTRDKLLLRNLILKKSQTENGIRLLEDRIKKGEQRSRSLLDFCVIGVKVIHAGVKMKIGDFSLLLDSDYCNMKFYPDKERIVSGPVLPSDRLD